MRISGEISVREARIPDELDVVRRLFREYQRELDIPVCFSSFEEEVAGLPDPYILLLLAEDDGSAVGCAAIRALQEVGCCELKHFTCVRRHAVKVRADVCSRLQRLWLRLPALF